MGANARAAIRQLDQLRIDGTHLACMATFDFACCRSLLSVPTPFHELRSVPTGDLSEGVANPESGGIIRILTHHTGRGGEDGDHLPTYAKDDTR